MKFKLTYKKALTCFLWLIASGIIALIYFQGTRVTVVDNQVKVGVTYMTMNNHFYKTLNSEIKKSVSDHNGILYVRDPELDEVRQSQQIDYFREMQVDVIVINPVKRDSPEIISALKQAQAEGIKLIVVDTQLEGIEVDSTIVSDNYQAGVLNAQNMMATVEQADILLLEHTNTVSARDRIQGFLDTIEGKEAYKVVARKDTLGQTEVGMPEVMEVINQGINFTVVMALNDTSALGALAAIKEKGLEEKIYIYGVDGSPDMKNLLYRTDDIQATVAQSPITMGEKTAEILFRLVEGKPVAKEYIIPVDLITKETIGQYDITGWQ
ncbi:substrate-binding domain-containing protein [Streptococcus oriscaviae]|uniref:Substrate-binding domain-containing protein n=1 Tax=Streptococcus oriscaviae TaxID=2781599 RepID=A0ABX7YJE1_9STRE|nr:substrate-binding domain-containing protein [Streptococcus oriscaviae]QUE53459.1 substrate-binding domain-containing protein [Streptococcus oriscaviae]